MAVTIGNTHYVIQLRFKRWCDKYQRWDRIDDRHLPNTLKVWAKEKRKKVEMRTDYATRAQAQEALIDAKLGVTPKDKRILIKWSVNEASYMSLGVNGL